MTAPAKDEAAALALSLRVQALEAGYRAGLGDLARQCGEAEALQHAVAAFRAATATIAALSGPLAAAESCYARADALMTGAVPAAFRGRAGRRDDLDRRTK